MAKTKSKKTGLSEKIRNKRKNVGNGIKSPFEVHINKQKLKVLGRKTKHEKGFPGLSRSKAIDKRKKTLLEEFKVRNKSNVFKDRRIAEHDPTLTIEEKQMARFAAIRQKAHKKSIFNLGDDDNFAYTDGEDILTHKGQALSEIEKFEDPRSDDDIDNEDDGKLDKKFVEQVHFGGGFLTTNQQEGSKSHKDILEQIIAESKKRKAEKKQTKEDLNELTEKLNTEWDDFVPLTKENIRKPEDKREDPSVDDFGKQKNKLKFEPRCVPSDPTKSEEELAKEEKERLDRLEKERLERMMNVEDVETDKYKSADDLDDNFVYESLSGDENDDDEKQNGSVGNDQDEGEDIDEGNESESEHDQSASESDSEDNLSDLKADTSDSEDEVFNEGKEVAHDENISKPQQRCAEPEIEEQNVDLPFTFPFPDDDEKLQSLLKGHTARNQGIIIERLIKCHHASLSDGNKEKLALLFNYILQYINDISSEAKEVEELKGVFSIFDALSPHLFDLAQMNQKPCSDSVREVIKEKFQEYIKKPKLYPELGVLFFLKMVSFLFPTSDFKHSVVTPCFVFMEKMLTTCRVSTRRHISYGLFLSTLVLEYTTLSKRFMPGCMNFLSGILHTAVPKSTVRLVKILPPFKSLSSDLVLSEDCSTWDFPLKIEVDDLVNGEVTEFFKIRAIHTAISICNEFLQNFKEYPSCVEIFEKIYEYCERIDSDMYPENVKTGMKTFMDTFEEIQKDRKLSYLKMEAAKPKLLKLYEPNIVEVYDRRTHKVQSKEKAERSKLLHKLKREKKGALREIRRDNAFLGRVKITKQIESDRERREKVKRIFAEANIQQSELNVLDRKRKKK